jgi:hypothetical protein
MSTQPKLTAETLWPTVADVTNFSDLCRRLYARGVFDLPYETRLALVDALATRLGLLVTGSTFRCAMKRSRWKNR